MMSEREPIDIEDLAEQVHRAIRDEERHKAEYNQAVKLRDKLLEDLKDKGLDPLKLGGIRKELEEERNRIEREISDLMYEVERGMKEES